MAKTAAERQADYRARKREQKTESGHEMKTMSVFISAPHRAILRKLAERDGVTMSDALARIIEESPEVKALEAEKDDFLSGRMSGN